MNLEELYLFAKSNCYQVHIKPAQTSYGYSKFACIDVEELKEIKSELYGFKVRGNNLYILFKTVVQEITFQDLQDYACRSVRETLGKLRYDHYIASGNNRVEILHNYKTETFITTYNDRAEAYLDVLKLG